jgi:hypothetical protein
MLNDCYKYATAINAKIQPFPTDLENTFAIFTLVRLDEFHLWNSEMEFVSLLI